MAETGGVEFGGNARFVVENRLGAGGFGIVYRAFDREQNRFVALKTFLKSTPESLYRIKREFRALADLAHPNLVALYELHSSDGQWFFTMELVDGVDFLEYVNVGFSSRADSNTGDTFDRLRLRSDTTVPALEIRPAGRSTRIRRLRVALMQLVRGVSALHQKGMLHRDIKPSNVLVTRSGRVVLLDFGLVTELQLEGVSRSLSLAGTPAYMSPERLVGAELTEASDWYSVGVLLYQAITGRLPYEGQLLDVVERKQREDPVPPAAIARDVPEDLDLLCRALLARDPFARPRGAEVFERLGDLPIALSSEGDRLPDLFVGRERHLTFLRETFESSVAGRPEIVLIRGGSGIGKSSLVHHFLSTRIERDEAVVLTGRCLERESVPFKALDGVIDALSRYLRGLPSRASEVVLPRNVGALLHIFPVLGRVDSFAAAAQRAPVVRDSEELRRRAFAAFRELLGRLCERTPLIVFIDDLQWGDSDSGVLLRELLKASDAPAMMLLACFRSEDEESCPVIQSLNSLASDSDSKVGLRHLLVEQLDRDESTDLASAILGGAGSSESEAEAIANESGGNPFFIVELARHLALMRHSSGELYEKAATAVETDVDAVIRKRVLALRPIARRLLQVIALAGGPIESRTASRIAGLGERYEGTLALLLSEHAIRATMTENGQLLEVVHERVQKNVVATLEEEDKRRLHHDLAKALEESGVTDAEVLAFHFRESCDLRRAFRYAVEAAAQADDALAFARAASLYRLALDLSSAADGEESSDLHEKLGDALSKAGRGADAARAFLEAAKGAHGDRIRDLNRKAAEQLLRSGHFDQGLAVLETVLSDIDMRLPQTLRSALIALIFRRMMLKLRGLAFDERAVEEIPAAVLARIDSCWSSAVGLVTIDPIRGAEFQTRHLLLALKSGEPYRIARALALETAYSSAKGTRGSERTELLCRKTNALAKRIDEPHSIGLATLTSGMAALCEGRWRKARELCLEAEEVLREQCTGVAWERDNAQIFSLAAQFFLGEIGELSRRLPLLLNEAEQRGDLYAQANLRIGFGFFSHFVWLAADDPARAETELRRALSLWSNQGFQLQHFWARGGEIDIPLYRGDDVGTISRVPRRWRALSRAMSRYVQINMIMALQTRARKRLAAARRLDGSGELIRSALADARRIERENAVWALPFAVMIRASAAAADRSHASAIELFASAEAGFEAADMLLHAVIARRRRGELAGRSGAGQVKEADEWLRAQGVRRPEKIADVLCPWAHLPHGVAVVQTSPSSSRELSPVRTDTRESPLVRESVPD